MTVPRAKRLSLIIGAVVVGLAALLLLADAVTSSPSACEGCHEIAPRAASWRESPHAQVPCVDCHVGPYEWYRLPRAVAARASLLVRDTVKHLSGEYQDPVDSRPDGAGPFDDAVCAECHAPGRRITPGPRILIDHDEHSARNKSCVSCHLRTAHPLPERGSELSFMGQCFTCHGPDVSALAPGECAICHPKDMDLLPQSHETSEWMPTHGGVALADRRLCAMCHDAQYCTDCHGVEMPHPVGWADAVDGHGPMAQASRAICEQCHEGGAELCTFCHHADYRPALGTWLEQHPGRTQEVGPKRCMSCHSPVDCAQCHAQTAE